MYKKLLTLLFLIALVGIPGCRKKSKSEKYSEKIARKNQRSHYA